MRDDRFATTLSRYCEAMTVIYIAAFLLALPILQRWLSLPNLMALFARRMLSGHLTSMEPERLWTLTQGLLKRRIGSFRPNCVKRSLVLFHLLHAWGYPVRVIFGVEKKAGVLAGHCWIEIDGQPLAEPDDPHLVFATTYRFPETAQEMQSYSV